MTANILVCFPHTFDGIISAACSCASCLWKSCIIIIIIQISFLLFLFAVSPWQHCQAQVTPRLYIHTPLPHLSRCTLMVCFYLRTLELVWRFLDPTHRSQPAWCCDPDSTRSNSSMVSYCFIYEKNSGWVSYQARQSCLSVRNISDQW